MDVKSYLLPPEAELRAVVGEDGIFRVTLLEGSAEVFGIELALNREYTFVDESVAVFTWYGCKLQTLSDNIDSPYIIDHTPMVAYVNTHMQLEAQRDVALANHDVGPRVLIAGPPDSGKSTMARILSAYACRLDRTPLYVDVDPGQSAVSIPGTISASALDKFSLNIEATGSGVGGGAGSGFHNTAPLVYSVGHITPKDHSVIYNKMAEILAERVQQRLDSDLDIRSSGVIINSCGYVIEEGYSSLLAVAAAFKVNIILVMGDDRLYSALCSSLKDTVTIVKLPRSGGVVPKERSARTRHRQRAIEQYFYGRRSITGASLPAGGSAAGLDSSGSGGGLQMSEFSPTRLEIQISSLVILRAGGLHMSENILALGESLVEATKLVRVAPTEREFDKAVLAVLHAPEEQEGGQEGALDGTAKRSGGVGAAGDDVPQSLLRANVAGFLYVVSINLETDTMTVLAPCTSQLPSRYLLLGSVKWAPTGQ